MSVGKFSVLLSVYYKEDVRYLTESLKSLASQNCKADEVVLVEDGPIPVELALVIDSFREQLRLRSIRLKRNLGLTIALNEGLKHCSYSLVARMDTDDMALPERFQKQIHLFENFPDLDVVGTYAMEINEYGLEGNLRKMPVSNELIYSNMFTNPFIHSSVMFKKSSVLSIGGYNQTLIRRQDYELWFRCAKAKMKFYNIPEPLQLYRFTEKTHARQNVKLMLEQALIGYRGVASLNQPYWKSLCCFIPFFRSLLPQKLRHIVYSRMKIVDPRQKTIE
jgi:glycosyltransferase involved in cell wall biosynthesis